MVGQAHVECRPGSVACSLSTVPHDVTFSEARQLALSKQSSADFSPKQALGVLVSDHLGNLAGKVTEPRPVERD